MHTRWNSQLTIVTRNRVCARTSGTMRDMRRNDYGGGRLKRYHFSPASILGSFCQSVFYVFRCVFKRKRVATPAPDPIRPGTPGNAQGRLVDEKEGRASARACAWGSSRLDGIVSGRQGQMFFFSSDRPSLR